MDRQADVHMNRRRHEQTKRQTDRRPRQTYGKTGRWINEHTVIQTGIETDRQRVRQ